MFTKEYILAEIKRTALTNGGIPLGKDRFFSETGIKASDWAGKIWARWSDALIEAGFQPNILQGQRDDEDLLGNLAILVRELGHFPVANEINLKARTAPGFPWKNTFDRFGGKQSLAKRLHDFCAERGQEDVTAICAKVIKCSTEESSNIKVKDRVEKEFNLGYVYLLKSGRYYKVGHTNALGRREYELAIQLPEKAKVVHYIKTDDPAGIESYWHNRFSCRRKNGEWFELSTNDLAAFKRRVFM